MGPDRQDKLESLDENERMSQEMDELLLTSKRLMEEMQALAVRATVLTARHVEIVKALKARKK